MSGCTAAQLERVVRAYRRGSRQDEAARERERFESRSFSVFPDDEENRRRGVEPDYYTAGARWKTEWDIPNSIYFNALEALA